MGKIKPILSILTASLLLTFLSYFVTRPGCGSFPDALCQHGWPYVFHRSGGIVGFNQWDLQSLTLDFAFFALVSLILWGLLRLMLSTDSPELPVKVHVVVNLTFATLLGSAIIIILNQPCKDGFFIGFCGIGNLVIKYTLFSSIIAFSSSSTIVRKVVEDKNLFNRNKAATYLLSLLISLPVAVVITIFTFYAFVVS